MAKKHRWRKVINSIIGTHAASEVDKQIRGNKTEIDEKLTMILGFVGEEDGNNDRKESIAALAEDFRTHYESLYARYDNLTNELKKEFQGSSSTSSDSSDSDDSSKKKEKESVEHGLNALSDAGELQSKLDAGIEEKEALNVVSVLNAKEQTDQAKCFDKLQTMNQKFIQTLKLKQNSSVCECVIKEL